MKLKRLLLEVTRVLLSLLFIVSGFVKVVDPWGTAIKIGDYLQAFGMEFLSGGTYFFSVLLSAGEMFLGFALLFHLGKRLFPRLVLAAMLFYTPLTLVLAIWNPVSDCGCFGDALKLTNWETFWKNVVLLSMALLVWWSAEREEHPAKKKEFRMVECSMGMLFALFSIGLGVYSLRHLPIIDFLPFQVGVHIPTEMAGGAKGKVETILIYKDKQDGTEHQFSLTDTIWYDTLRWEFVDTRFVEEEPTQNPTINEFSIFGADGDIASALLASKDPFFLVTMTQLNSWENRCSERMESLVQYASAHSVPVIGVTAASLPEGGMFEVVDRHIPIYNMDGTTLKSLIRAHAGVVLIQDGTILAKWNCADLPHFDGKEKERGVLSWVVHQAEATRLGWLLGVMASLFVLIYASYFIHLKKRGNS